jgi:hypothetical protein
VRDLVLPAGATTLTDGALTVVQGRGAAHRGAEPEAEPAAGEPEVLRAKKAEG